MNTISNTDNTIDSRDIVARLEELQEEQTTYADDVEEKHQALKDVESTIEASQDTDDASYIQDGEERASMAERLQEELESAQEEYEDATQALKEWDEENKEELSSLEALNDQGSGYGDWEHGETLIHESYFTDYCQELVSDIGDMPREIPDYIVIDWEATAENLKADYTELDFDGETYYMRA
jgi:DNA repair ATPase RecN